MPHIRVLSPSTFELHFKPLIPRQAFYQPLTVYPCIVIHRFLLLIASSVSLIHIRRIKLNLKGWIIVKFQCLQDCQTQILSWRKKLDT